MVTDWGLTLVTGPTVEPVSLQEVKDLGRANWDVEDAMIDRLITAARRHGESITRRQFITAIWQLSLDSFPCGRILRLPRAPLASVTSVEYDDKDGVERTLAASAYRALTGRTPGAIESKTLTGQIWPETYEQADAVRITFVAGYGAAAANVPEDIRDAIAWLAAWRYEHRELDTIPAAFEAMLAPYNDFGTFEP